MFLAQAMEMERALTEHFKEDPKKKKEKRA